MLNVTYRCTAHASIIARRPAAEAVAVPRDPAIQRPPHEHAAREVQERRRPPQPPQPARQVANRLRPPVPVAVAVDDHHFLHHPVVRQVGPAAGDFRVVQRKIRELFLAVPPRQLADLGRADAGNARRRSRRRASGRSAGVGSGSAAGGMRVAVAMMLNSIRSQARRVPTLTGRTSGGTARSQESDSRPTQCSPRPTSKPPFRKRDSPTAARYNPQDRALARVHPVTGRCAVR